jgi:hypothetical protein
LWSAHFVFVFVQHFVNGKILDAIRLQIPINGKLIISCW